MSGKSRPWSKFPGNVIPWLILAMAAVYVLCSLDLLNTPPWQSRSERIAEMKGDGEKIVAAIAAYSARENKLPQTLASLHLNDSDLEYWWYETTDSGSHYYLTREFPERRTKSSVLKYKDDGAGWTMTDDNGETTKP